MQILYNSNIINLCRSLVEHRQTEDYNSFARRAGKTMAAVCVLIFNFYKI